MADLGMAPPCARRAIVGRFRARLHVRPQGSGLFYAKIGDVGGLAKKVAKGWDCNTVTDKHGLTALQWAAGAGERAMAQYLVEQLGAHIDRANKEGRTPLMWGCRNGHLELSKYLVSKGADIHATTKKGVSCLHWVSACSSAAFRI